MNNTKYRYSILTFIFNGYDRVRTPLFIDKDAEYVLVSDHYFEHPIWKVIVDEDLKDKDPIYQSYYVRYHPFKYLNSDIAIVIDGSIKILSDLSHLIDEVINTNRDMMIMCSNYLTVEQKLEHWKTIRKLDDESINNIKKLQTELGAEDLMGGIANAFKICRNNDINRNFHSMIWGYLLECGINGSPNRLDELVEHMVLNAFFMNMKLTITCTQIIHSNLMRHYWHNSCVETYMPSDYNDFYFLCSKPVNPKRYGNERLYPTKYKYKTEAILLTRYLNEQDMDEWIDWHLNKCGFEHIQIFVNNIEFNILKYSQKLDDDRVSITEVPGNIRQYRIYDNYINEQSEAKWIMPIDDDEYLSISPEFNNIYEAICYYECKFPHLDMLAVRWKHMFPKKFREEREGKVLDYCTEENKELAVTFTKGGDRTVKTIVKRYGLIHYQESFENLTGGHVPKHSCTYAATLFDGTRVISTALNDFPKDTSDEKIRLLHCRYSGIATWNKKYGNEDPKKNCLKISNYVYKEKNFLFNKLLPFLE